MKSEQYIILWKGIPQRLLGNGKMLWSATENLDEEPRREITITGFHSHSAALWAIAVHLRIYRSYSKHDYRAVRVSLHYRPRE